MNHLHSSSDHNGFSFLELLITVSIIGILSTVSLVNLSRSWHKERLLSTTRELENWLSDQRRHAMNGNLTCRIEIDHVNKRLISTIDSSHGIEPCDVNASTSQPGIFNLATSFGNGSEGLSLASTPTTYQNHKTGGLRFSFRGFSQNYQLTSEEKLELRLSHVNLGRQRCIRIISPIGMMRDGFAMDASSPCRYDNAY